MPQKEEVLIIELTDRSRSGFIMEGTERSAHPVHLDHPSFYRVLNRSRVVQPDGSFRAIRFIKGSNTIFVDEQDARGHKPNRNGEDEIVIKDARMTIIRRGNEIALYDFLRACEFNEHAENKPTDRNVCFREIRAVEIAKADISGMKKIKQAVDLVDDLISEGAGGEYLYDVERMEQLVNILGLAKQDSPEETIAVLMAFAKSRPVDLIDTVADKTKDFRAAINEGLSLKTIYIDNKVVSRPDAGSSTGVTIVKLKSSTREKQVDELLSFFLSAEGAPHYRALSIDNDATKAKLLETA